MKYKAMLLLFFSLLISACEKEKGSEVLGTWEQIGHANSSLVIDKNGDNFIIRRTRKFPWNETPKTDNLVAVYKDGGLQLTGLPGTSMYSVDQKTGHLVGFGEEYLKKN